MEPGAFYRLLKESGVVFFSGVPDSLMKDFCGYVSSNVPSDHHVIAANEGGAIALAMGHYLATGDVPLVYMQNSGLGNAVNPLLSLADPQVYSIPMLLLVGWRGEPETIDEPQHRKQGRVMLPMLDAMEIPYRVLESNSDRVASVVKEAVSHARAVGGPFALVVRKGLFSPHPKVEQGKVRYPLLREDAVKLVVAATGPTDVIVSTTGMISRELFEYRVAQAEGHGRDFLTVGGMGHASQIALGIAIAQPERNVFCMDGDGAVLMHMGSLAIIGSRAPANFRHVVINNGAHESVGGQPTVGFEVDLVAFARGAGYRTAVRAESRDQVEPALRAVFTTQGPGLVEIRVQCGHRQDLGRPTKTPSQNKQDLMTHLRQ